MLGPQQSILTETAICIVEWWKKTMGATFCSWEQSCTRKSCMCMSIFFCAIFAGPLVLPWLHGVLTLNKQKSYSKLETKLVWDTCTLEVLWGGQDIGYFIIVCFLSVMRLGGRIQLWLILLLHCINKESKGIFSSVSEWPERCERCYLPIMSLFFRIHLFYFTFI